LDNVLDLLSGVIKQGGTIHFYTFKSGQEIEPLQEMFRDRGFTAGSWYRCGYVAPGIGRYVFDLEKD
ncbi:MAG: hypothetical protein LUQ12_04685, partial [Methanoregulaceae archaeon]|nr:hypothetical protein [Methanoregulaceae archaeon]